MASGEITTEFMSGIFIIISVLLGYYLSNYQWKKQREIEKGNIAIGFHKEITEIKNVIDTVIKGCKDFENISDDNKPVLSNAFTLREAVNKTGGPQKFHSLYNTAGMYFQFRKEIYGFDSNTIDKLLSFYSNIQEPVNLFSIYMSRLSLRDVSPYAPLNEAMDIQNEIFTSLINISDESTDLLHALEKYINKRE